MTRSVGKGRDKVPDRVEGRALSTWPAREVLYQDSVNSSSGCGCVHRWGGVGWGGSLCSPAHSVIDFDHSMCEGEAV